MSSEKVPEPVSAGLASSASSCPELPVLALLIAVGQDGSIAAAAQRVGMAQPNASRALRRLERSLGFELVLRRTSGSLLTSEGQAVARWAQLLLDQAESFTRAVSALRGRAERSLTVSASQTVAEYFLPHWLARMREDHPDVVVALSVGNSVAVQGDIVAGRADLGFVETSRLGWNVASRTVAHDELVLVVAPGHPWARERRTVGLDEVAGTPLVVREGGSGTRAFLEDLCGTRGLAPVRPAQALTSNAAVHIAARAGIAPAVLSRHVVADSLQTGALRPIPISGLSLRRRLTAVWRRGSSLCPQASAFLESASLTLPRGWNPAGSS